MKQMRCFVFLVTVLALPMHAESADVIVCTSPDGQILIDNHSTKGPGDFSHFDFWAVSRDGRHRCLLNRGETGPSSVYGAGFRFSPNSEWLIRMQKIAAGESTLFLYHREGWRFVPATARPLGDLAWDFFSNQPESDETDSHTLSPEADLVNGLQNNFASLGEHWPDSRYILIDLSSGESGTYPFGPWRCAYDMELGRFSVPPDCAKFNETSAARNWDDQKQWKAKNPQS